VRSEGLSPQSSDDRFPLVHFRSPRLGQSPSGAQPGSHGQGGCRVPAVDVGSYGACAPPDINRPVEQNHGRRSRRITDRQSALITHELCFRRSHHSFPGIEPGADWHRVQPAGCAVAGLELCPHVVTTVRNGGIGAGDERRPGGHLAGHGRPGYSIKPLPPTWIIHVHTVASADANVTPARRETLIRDGLHGAPEGRRTPGCIGVDAKCTALAEPRVTFKSADRRARCPPGRRSLQGPPTTVPGSDVNRAWSGRVPRWSA
jgi:hypothetical protein